MKNDSELARKSLELSFEFSRYLLANPALEAKLPDNPLLVFEVDDDPELTAYQRELARRNREKGQPLVTVHVKGLAPTRLVAPEVTLTSA